MVAITVVFLPLFASIISAIGYGYKLPKQLIGAFASLSMAIAAGCSLSLLLIDGLNENTYHLVLAPWFEFAEIAITWSLYFDPLSIIMAVVITIVSTIVHIYSIGYMENDAGFNRFISYLSLFTFFMLLLISADNFLQLFLGWEGVGLCSYLLISFWYTKPSACAAAFKAFIVNRVGDVALLLGILLLAYYCNSLKFTAVLEQGEYLQLFDMHFINDWKLIDWICLLLFIGCMGKSAQVGLHVWLPDAMEGPTPVSALIHAATMVTAGVFLLARCSALFEYAINILPIISIIGAITCLGAATIALVQNDIKKIIAYSTCSQLGYMFMACGSSAYQAGIFHLFTHAFFKALLFLAAGNIIHATEQQDIRNLYGLRKNLPYTFILMLIGNLAISGIYPLAGYYSKEAILTAVYDANHPYLFYVGVIGAFCTAIYSTRLMSRIFFGSVSHPQAHEGGLVMIIPLGILAIGAIFSGMYGMHIGILDTYFHNSITILNTAHLHLPHLLSLLPLVAAVLGFLTYFCIYHFHYSASSTSSILSNSSNSSLQVPMRISMGTFMSSSMEILKPFVYPFVYILQNKYFFDQIYSNTIVKFTQMVSKEAAKDDKRVIDLLIPRGISYLARYAGYLINKIQSGYIFHYMSITSGAVIALLTWIVFRFYLADHL